jgi:uncharacterized glyoxalase superfamily protein PhnB
MTVTVRPSVVPILWYERPRDAIDWLCKALGFEALMVVADEGEGVIHSELGFGDGAIYVVGPPRDGMHGASPRGVQGKNTQHVHLNLAEGLDAHCANARAQGAMIEREPADQPYGDRVYTCLDPEGHSWSFGQPVKEMSVAAMADATGHRIETPNASRG